MPRPKVHGLESYKDLPLYHPQRRRIQNRNAQRTYRRKKSERQAEGGENNANADCTSTNTSTTDTINNNNSNHNSPNNTSNHASATMNSVATPSTQIYDSSNPQPADLDAAASILTPDASAASSTASSAPGSSYGTMDQPLSALGSPFDIMCDTMNLDTHDSMHPAFSIGDPSNPFGMDDPTFGSLAALQQATPESSDAGSTTSTKDKARCNLMSQELSSDMLLMNPDDAFSPLCLISPPQSTTQTSSGLVSPRGDRSLSLDSTCFSADDGSCMPSDLATTTSHAPTRNHSSGSLDGLMGLQTPAAGYDTQLTRYNTRDTDDRRFSLLNAAPLPTDAPLDLGQGAIHTCCKKGHMRLVKALVESRVPVNKPDAMGNTPLHYAAMAGHEDIALYLLEHEADINATNVEGWTPAHLASENGHAGCLRLLSELNAALWARVPKARPGL